MDNMKRRFDEIAVKYDFKKDQNKIRNEIDQIISSKTIRHYPLNTIDMLREVQSFPPSVLEKFIKKFTNQKLPLHRYFTIFMKDRKNVIEIQFEN